MMDERQEPMERIWYYAVDGVRHGPVTFEELRGLVRKGSLKSLDLVWQPEFGPEWRNIGQVRAMFEAVAPPVPPPVETCGHQVPLLGVGGARPSCLEAMSLAFARMTEVLFRPFDVMRWFSMGFCAWLAYIGLQTVYRTGDANAHEVTVASFKQQADAALDWLMLVSGHPSDAAKMGVRVLMGVLFALWMCALRSRGDFMFMHRWYRPDAPIRQCWQASRAAARELFVWRFYFFLISFLLCALDGLIAFVKIVKPYLDAGKMWQEAFVEPTVVCVTVLVLLGVGIQVVAHLTKAFVVPVMYWHGVTATRAWLVVFALCNQYPFAVFGYLICTLVCWVLAFCAVFLFVLLTCCVGLVPLILPYVGAVVLLPVYLFFRGYAVCFLSQWRPDLIPVSA